MNDRPSSLFTISFRMERDDFVALSTTLARQYPRPTLIKIAVYLLALFAIAWLEAGGSTDELLAALAANFAFPNVLFYGLVVAGPPLLLLMTPQLAGLIAAAGYRRNAIADRDVTLHVTAEGIEGGAAGLYSRIGWAGVSRLIETPSHLFVLISRREALLIPRRAVPDEDVYSNIRGFIRARTGLSTG